MKLRFLLSLLISCCIALSAAVALETGSKAPDFTLSAHDGSTVRLADLKDKTVVLEWFNAGCPFVKKHYRHGDMQRLQKEYADRGVVWLMVNSTKADHKDYLAPSAAAAFIREQRVEGARMLLDPTGSTGKAYGARTTPHLFIIAPNGTLAYQGAIDDDDSTDGDPKNAQNYARAALDAILAGKPAAVTQTQSYGCSIKYAA